MKYWARSQSRLVCGREEKTNLQVLHRVFEPLFGKQQGREAREKKRKKKRIVAQGFAHGAAREPNRAFKEKRATKALVKNAATQLRSSGGRQRRGEK